MIGTILSVQLRELLDNPGFRTGFEVGVTVLLVALLAVAASALRRSRGRAGPTAGPGQLPPLAGIGVLVAAGIALVADEPATPQSTRLVIGLALLVIGPFVVTTTLRSSGAAALYAMLAAIPGAAFVAWAASAANGLRWIPWLVLGATLVGGALVADFDRANARAGLGPVLLAIAALGMYSTLPDTEQVAVVVGAALPFALLGAPFALASLGPAAYGIVGLIAWVAAIGGRGRQGSVVAAIACLGLMLVEPVVRRGLRGRLRSPRSPRSAAAAWFVVLQIPLVLMLARVAGLRTSARSAAGISALLLAAATTALAAVLTARGEGVGGRAPDSESPSSGEPATFSAPADRRDPSAS